MRQGLSNTQRLDTSIRVDPRLIVQSQVLALSTVELEQALQTELTENPALERLDDDPDEVTDEEILRTVAPQELFPGSEDAEFHRCRPNDEEALDWLDLTSDGPCLGDHLRAQLLPRLPADLAYLGDYVIGCLNENGYMAEPPEEVALATNRSMDEVERTITLLQQCEPAGIGARDLKECLLLQLRDAGTVEEKLARLIVKRHLEDFAARRAMRIGRRYGVMPEVVESAFKQILALRPFPAEGFSTTTYRAPMRSQAVRPDLVLTRSEQGWDIGTPGIGPDSLRVSPSYRRRQRELSGRKQGDPQEKRHIGAMVQRAEEFIAAVDQRRRTTRRIGQYLVEHQSGFVSTGRYEFLRPLTRAALATALDIHESTVSRATMGKFVQLATGDIVSFEIFFKPALRVQKMIEEILATENPDDPLSDERIAQILAERGVNIARRTVNKYRDRHRLLSSRRRKSA